MKITSSNANLFRRHAVARDAMVRAVLQRDVLPPAVPAVRVVVRVRPGSRLVAAGGTR